MADEPLDLQNLTGLTPVSWEEAPEPTPLANLDAVAEQARKHGVPLVVPQSITTTVFEDYYITAKLENSHVIGFRVVRVIGKCSDGTYLYGEDASETSSRPDTASAFLEGSIKWDGCSNWSFSPDEDVMVHLCGRNRAEGIGRLMGELYRLAETYLPTFDRKLAE